MPSFYIDLQETFNAQMYIYEMWTHLRSLVQLPTGEIGEKVTERVSPMSFFCFKFVVV